MARAWLVTARFGRYLLLQYLHFHHPWRSKPGNSVEDKTGMTAALFEYPDDIRKAIYTTNAIDRFTGSPPIVLSVIERVHCQIRHAFDGNMPPSQ